MGDDSCENGRDRAKGRCRFDADQPGDSRLPPALFHAERTSARRTAGGQQPAVGRREDLRLLVGPFARAVDRLRAETAAATTDRVVPLGPHQVNRRVQVLAAALGLEGVSAHSGRRGLASELVRRGASTTAVQAAGGWRSPAMVARYASAVAVEDGAVARLFGGEQDPDSSPSGGHG